MRPAAGALALLALLTVPGGAMAEGGGAVDEARERFDRGMDLFARGDLEAALADFLRAYEISPNSAVLYNIGTVQARLRRYAAAVASLERYLAEGAGSVPAGRRAEVERELERLRGLVGHLRVTVRPETGAVVLIDGVEAGRLPLASTLAISAGRREVEIRAEGFLPHRRELTVAGGAEVAVEVALTRAEPPGAIMVSVSVPYATVSIGGEPVGTTPITEPVAVQPGRHEVEASRPGYEPARATVEVRGGEVVRTELALSQLPDLPPELAGALDVRVSEEGVVRFLLDGAPMPEGVVPVGPHRLEVRLEGFEPWVGDVEVARGRPTSLEVAMRPTPNFREEYERRARGVRVGSYASLGAGGALLVVGLALELWNSIALVGDWQAEDDLLSSQYRLDLDDPGRLPRDELVGRQEDNDALAAQIGALRVADVVMMGLGAAAVVTGVLLWVLGPDPGRFAGLSVGPAPGGLALSW